MASLSSRSIDGNARPSRSGAQAAGQGAAAERRAGRRAISVALLLIGVFAAVSGFWSLFVPRGSLLVLAHVVGGSAFLVLSVAHVRFNRNALRLYLRDLGWSPAVLRLVIAAAISLILLAPVVRLV
jgi:hypothetical protein